MAEKRAKADLLQKQTEQHKKRLDRHLEAIDKRTSTVLPKTDEPIVQSPIEQQIQKRAYELYEQRGKRDGHEWDDWLQAENEIKGTQATT